MRREHLVGVIMNIPVETDEPEDYLVTKVLGEGNEKVVCSISPMRDLSEHRWVTHLWKPDRRLEMTVLHHSWRIAEELYPDHPLLMTPEERMRRLADEMIQRVRTGGVMFRVSAYKELLDQVVDLLVFRSLGPFKEGRLSETFLSELPGVLDMLDDCLATMIEQMLDEEACAESERPFFEHCLNRIRETIAERAENGSEAPLPKNPFFNLLGLHIERFISWDELVYITNDPRIRETASDHHVLQLLTLLTIMHARARHLKRLLDLQKRESTETEPEPEPDMSEFFGSLPPIPKLPSPLERRYYGMLSGLKAACSYVGFLAPGSQLSDVWLRAEAQRWYARSLLLGGELDTAKELLSSAVSQLLERSSLVICHQLLLDLGKLEETRDPVASRKYCTAAAAAKTLVDFGEAALEDGPP